MVNAFEAIYEKAIAEQKQYPSQMFPNVEGMAFNDCINKTFTLKDAKITTGKKKNKNDEWVDTEKVHLLVTTDDGTDRVLIIGAYRIVTTFKKLIKDNDLGAFVGSKIQIYQIGPLEGYMIRTV